MQCLADVCAPDRPDEDTHLRMPFYTFTSKELKWSDENGNMTLAKQYFNKYYWIISGSAICAIYSKTIGNRL